MTKRKTIPIFVAHMGCPNDCAFCNQRTITGHTDTVTPKMAENIIEKSLATIKKDTFVEIGFFGGSFTGIDKTLQTELLQVANCYLERGFIKAIRLSTRPDYIDENIVAFLKSYGVTTVELGAQSMNDRVLSLNRRGHSASDTFRAAKIIQDGGLSLGLQMMTGLYGDTPEICMKGARKIADMSPACVRIYPTLVLKNTYLAKLYNEGVYQPQSLEDAVLLCADLKELFDEKNIPVIRMGLMASDNIDTKNDVVAGPFHPSFGELVQSEQYFRRLKKSVVEDSVLFVHPTSVSAFIGNQKWNIKRMKQLGIQIEFRQDESVLPGEFIQKKGGKSCV